MNILQLVLSSLQADLAQSLPWAQTEEELKRRMAQIFRHYAVTLEPDAPVCQIGFVRTEKGRTCQ